MPSISPLAAVLRAAIAATVALSLISPAQALRRDGPGLDAAEAADALSPGIHRNGTLLHGVTLEHSASPVPVLVSVAGSKRPMAGLASLQSSNRVVIQLSRWGDHPFAGRVLEQNSKMDGLRPSCVKSAIAFTYKCLVAELPTGTPLVTVLLPAPLQH